jgi:hypothetical protein
MNRFLGTRTNRTCPIKASGSPTGFTVRHAARPLGAGVRDAADRVPAAFARDIGPAVPARSAFLGGCADAKHSSGAA